MAPRSYDMSKRSRAREETRRRIVEATARLHARNGVFGTSWRQIADEADVSVATVYAHFPSLDELLPACGSLVMERIRPPASDAAAEVVGDAEAVEARVTRVARELFDFYDRGGSYIEVDIRERELPEMRRWEQHLLDLAAAYAREALAPAALTPTTLSAVSALLDLPTFKAFRARDIGPEAAAQIVGRLAGALVEGAQIAGEEQNRRRKR